MTELGLKKKRQKVACFSAKTEAERDELASQRFIYAAELISLPGFTVRGAAYIGPSSTVNGLPMRSLCPVRVQNYSSNIMEWSTLPGLQLTSNLLWDCVKSSGGWNEVRIKSILSLTGPEYWPNNTVGSYVQYHLIRTIRAVYGADPILTDPIINISLMGSVTPRLSCRWANMSKGVSDAIQMIEETGNVYSAGAFYKKLTIEVGKLHRFIPQKTLTALGDDLTIDLVLCGMMKLWHFLIVATAEEITAIKTTNWD